MTNTESHPSTSIVLGGGGVYGIFYNKAVMDALRAHGLFLENTPPIYGTSAGAWAAGCLALHKTITNADDIPPLSLQNRDIHAMSRDLFGDELAPPNMHTFTIALSLRGSQPVKMSEMPIADMTAASAALPGIFKPVIIDGVRYIDGNYTRPESPTHARHAAPADFLLVVAPTAFSGGGMQEMSGGRVRRRVEQEVAMWRDANPNSTAILITPSERVSRLVPTPLALLDRRVGLEAYKRAWEDTMQMIENPRSPLHHMVKALGAHALKL